MYAPPYIGTIISIILLLVLQPGGHHSALVSADTQTVCQDQELFLDCPNTESLIITEAVYFGTDDMSCTAGRSVTDASCISSTSISVVMFQCLGKQSCRLFASEFLFGNPCPNNISYLQVTFSCTSNQIHSLCSTSIPSPFASEEVIYVASPLWTGDTELPKDCTLSLLPAKAQALHIELIVTYPEKVSDCDQNYLQLESSETEKYCSVMDIPVSQQFVDVTLQYISNGYLQLLFKIQSYTAQCKPPTTIPNGWVTTQGNVTTYSCFSDHTLVGDSTRICSTVGTWTGEEPRCDPIRCKHPGEPDHGTTDTGFVAQYPVGTDVVFSCDNGYTLIGTSKIKCQNDGTWDNDLPRCTVIRCPEPPSITNGNVTHNSTAPGGIAVYVCYLNFFPKRPQTQMCSSTGQWTGPLPKCAKSNSPQIGTFSNLVTDDPVSTPDIPPIDVNNTPITPSNTSGSEYPKGLIEGIAAVVSLLFIIFIWILFLKLYKRQKNNRHSENGIPPVNNVMSDWYDEGYTYTYRDNHLQSSVRVAKPKVDDKPQTNGYGSPPNGSIKSNGTYKKNHSPSAKRFPKQKGKNDLSEDLYDSPFHINEQGPDDDGSKAVQENSSINTSPLSTTYL